MKRSMSPTYWPVERKTKRFVITPVPGPHGKDKCMPLGVVLRDVLRYANTAKEARMLLNGGNVNVDNRIRKDEHFPVGLMDVLAIGEENYRMLPGRKGLRLQKIDYSEAGIKPEKIVSKTALKRGRIQLNLFDGRNMIADKDGYETGDTLVLDTKSNAVTQLIKMKKGALVIVTGGKNSGKTGIVDSITLVKTHAAQVTINIDGGKIIVPKDYTFAIGDKEPVIKVGE